MTVPLTATEYGTIAAVGAAVVPPFVSLLKSEKWPVAAKQGCALAASAIVAFVGLVIAGVPVTTTRLSSLVGLCFTGSQTVYQLYFRQSVAETVLRKLGTKKKAPKPTPVTPPAGQAAA